MKTIYKICTINTSLETCEKVMFSATSILNQKNDKYYVYAVTDNKKHKQEFLSIRNSDLFVVLKEYIDENIDMSEIYDNDLYLDYREYNYLTDNGTVDTINILSTKREYLEVLKESLYLENIIFKSVGFKINNNFIYLNNDYIDILNKINYIPLYNYVYNGYDKPNFTINTFNIFMKQNKHLFSEFNER